jgi:hypothetical protein
MRWNVSFVSYGSYATEHRIEHLAPLLCILEVRHTILSRFFWISSIPVG